MRPPPRRGFRLVVHVPASILRVEKGIFKKTFVTGLVARACSIFRTDVIDIYRDPETEERDLVLMRKVLEYMRTPSYLRKHLISVDRDLRGVGVLPPLATPNQPVPGLSSEHVREALVTRADRERVCLEAGLGRDVCIDRSVFGHREVSVGQVVYVRVRGGVVVGIEDERFLERFYWVYDVSVSGSLREALERFRGPVVVSTRKGRPLDQYMSRAILERVGGGDLSVVFGSPDKDPDEIAEEEGWDIREKTDLFINTAPLQGVRTIRTYEALYITLALLNNFFYVSKGL